MCSSGNTKCPRIHSYDSLVYTIVRRSEEQFLTMGILNKYWHSFQAFADCIQPPKAQPSLSRVQPSSPKCFFMITSAFSSTAELDIATKRIIITICSI